MRGRGLIIVLGVMAAALALPVPGRAQFSPQGVIGAVTAPLRHMLGDIAHFPRLHRHGSHHAAAAAPPATEPDEGALAHLGPPAWPSAYADIIGYVFWPGDYARMLQEQGFDVIALTITGPLASRIAARNVAATTGAAAAADASDCKPAIDAGGWPQSMIGQSVKLDAAADGRLRAFQAALVQAAGQAAPDCSDLADVPAPERLGRLINALWAVHDTGLLVRGPLIAFENGLTAAQKAAFAAPAQTEAQQDKTQQTADAANKAMQTCAEQNVGEAERMIKVVEQRTRPTKEQAASLEKLRKVATNMAKLLIPSCTNAPAADPLARLDAADDQLTTMIYAASSVQIAVTDFYNGLSAQQKARFDGSR